MLYKTLYLTWRIQVLESQGLKQILQKNGPRVYAHWHGDELAILYLLKPYRASAMISTSKDGDLMNSLVRWLGARTSRGSSTRGGVSAVRGIVRLVSEGYYPSMAVDGPKGPFHKVKPGVFELSKILHAPILPLTVAVDRAWVFSRSWNKTYLPKPFAKISVVWGEPLPGLQRNHDPHDPDLQLALESALNAAGQHAAHLLASR